MTHRQRSWAIAAIAFMGGIGGGVVFPILPVVGVQLGIAGAMIGLILSANRITRLFCNPLTGIVIDRFGTRWPVAAGLILEAAGAATYALALTAHWPGLWFLVGRVVWGFGSSLLLVGVLSAVLAISEPAVRGGMTARVRTALSLGFPGGLVIGGLVADLATNNAAFLTAAALSLLAGLAAVGVLPRHGRTAATPDMTNTDSPQGSWRELLALDTLRVILITNVLLFFAVTGILLATVALVAETRHLHLLGLGAQGSAGILMAILMGARATASLTAGHHLDHSDSRTRLLLPSVGAIATGFLLFGLAPGLVLSTAGLLCIGAGAGGLTIPMLTLLGDVVPDHLHGRALSVYQWSADLGGSFGPILGLVLGQRLGYTPIYVVVGLLMLVMAIPLSRLVKAERRPM